MTTVAAETFLFEALSEKAQQAALDRYRYCWVDYDWWDNTYEDVVHTAEILGIEIDKHYGNGPKIYFSGFCSQGDGASFTGRYNPKADALTVIQAQCSDETLIDLAKRLTVINVATSLTEGLEGFHAEITIRGHYSHPSTINVEVHFAVHDEFIDINIFPEEFEKELTACMREFADWIYQQLEAEHDFLTSDEYLKEQFAEDKTEFDEDGAMI